MSFSAVVHERPVLVFLESVASEGSVEPAGAEPLLPVGEAAPASDRQPVVSPAAGCEID